MATGVRGTTVARLVGLALLFTVLGASAASAAQTTPQFLDRIFATGNANLDIDDTDDQRVDVDVAVFDTSLNLSDPDINVVGTTGCMHPDPDDENYVAPDTEDPDWHGDPANPGRGCMDNAATPYDHFHGTGTAQVAAAIDNDLDIVGVAPGARVGGVDVQRVPMFSHAAAGHPEMDLYPVIAGVKWVTATRTDNDPDNDIEVVAMGWGCSTESDPTPLQPVCPYDDPDFADPIEQLEDAIANAVDEGVVFVAPAGNRDSDVSVFDSQTDPGTWIPASYDDVIGVSVLTDTDGLPGGLGPNSTAHCGGSTYTGTLTDDSFQNGSNWGAAIDIAAPSPSGCASGSAPLVAGAAAVLASADPPTSRSEVEDLTADLIDAGNLNWTDDS